jgi:drug/metabolite transporter (DMT)-like permease
VGHEIIGQLVFSKPTDFENPLYSNLINQNTMTYSSRNSFSIPYSRNSLSTWLSRTSEKSPKFSSDILKPLHVITASIEEKEVAEQAIKKTRLAGSDITVRAALLTLLGLFGAVRLAAIKAAGLSGVPVHVVVSVAATGIAVFFTARAIVTSDWPPLNRRTAIFYLLSAGFGFLAPFALESTVAPELPVFVFVVIITTMPILTLVLSILTGGERLSWRSVVAVTLGFVSAVAILWDTGRADAGSEASPWWVVAAFGVPALYALGTIFVSRCWPARVNGLHVVHAETLIAATAALLGSLAAGTLGDWRLAAQDVRALTLIVIVEALASLVYYRIARDDGATWVSFANYVSMIFAAIIGAVVFGDRIGTLTVAAALGIIASVWLYQRRETSRETD